MTQRFPSLTLASIQQHFSDGGTPEQLVQMVRQRITERGDDSVWIYLPPLEETLQQAREVASDAPLRGLPFAVKDNIEVAGWPTTAACPSFSYVAQKDAPVVARLRAAGAIPIGKTNMDQFATGLVGTRSPYGVPSSVFSADHISGGSSSGSAVAVTAGEVAFALGTDTAGSGRVPAAFNNLVGIKPSCGLLSTGGVVPACRSLDCVSILSASVADGTAVRRIAEGYDEEDPYSKTIIRRRLPERPVIGVPHASQLSFFGDELAASAFTEAVEKARGLGWDIIEIDYRPFQEMAQQLYAGPWVAERLAALESFLQGQPDDAHPVVRDIILGAAKFSAVDAYRGLYERERLRKATNKVWQQMDVLLLPTVPTHPTIAAVLNEPLKLNAQLGTYTNFVNLLDLAAIAIPANFRPDGLPTGITLISHAGTDEALASLGAAFCGEMAFRQQHSSEISLAVVGAHLQGQPLHKQLTDRKARLLQTTRTAACYQLYALPGTVPPKPGLVRSPEFSGPGLELEIYALEPHALGDFLTLVPPPLVIGNVQLTDSTWVKGFLCEPSALPGAQEITHFGGWRAYLASQERRSI